MATGDYCSVDELTAAVGIHDAADDTLLQIAITSASRQVDGFCGRRFYQDTDVVVREFYATSPTCVDLLDQPGTDPKVEISTTTGLIVKVDTGTDQTFATTLTLNSHFYLLPRNASADSRPWSEIVLGGSTTSYFPRLSNGLPGIQITARYGWATVPEAVKQATILQAELLFKSKDAPFGAAQLGETTAVFQRTALHPAAKVLLTAAGLQRAPVG